MRPSVRFAFETISEKCTIPARSVLFVLEQVYRAGYSAGRTAQIKKTDDSPAIGVAEEVD